MIDALLSILDRLLKLKSLKDARSRAVFEDILAPTFADLERIHKDYLQLYDQVSQRLPSFEFLSKPGTNWLSEHNYVNFVTKEDAQRFLEMEGRKDEKLHASLCGKGYFIEYPVPDDQPPLLVIFRERYLAEEAAQRVGVCPVYLMPPPTIPQNVYSSIQDLVSFVREKRIEYEPVRVRLKSLGQIFSQVPLGLSGDLFVRAVLDYFPDGRFKPYWDIGDSVDANQSCKGYSSGATSILDALRDVDNPGAAEDAHLLNRSCCKVEGLLFSLQDHQKEQWERVSNAFAHLQAERLRLW